MWPTQAQSPLVGFYSEKGEKISNNQAQEVTRSLPLQQETPQPEGTFRSDPENSTGSTGNRFFKGKGDNTG